MPFKYGVVLATREEALWIKHLTNNDKRNIVL